MKNIIEKICERTYSNGVRFDGRIPTNSTDAYGRFDLGGGGWTDGFYIGMVYLAYALTKHKKFLEIADKYQPYFRLRAENNPDWCRQNNILPLDHDTGFIFKLSQVYRYKLIGDTEARTLALKAADILASRFNSVGRFIRAWDTWSWDTDPQFIEDKKGKMIIDSMMNIALLFWAYEETGNKQYYDIAASHTDTVAKYVVRPDGSTFHQYNFDPLTGEPKKGVTGQGYSDDSCWSRGQAWAVYGFTEAYEYTKNTAHLDTAEKIAHYFISHLMPYGLPLWDFACTNQTFRPIDASAAAIALSGLITLNKHRPSDIIESGITKLKNGLLTHCNALSIENWESVLLHACIGSAYQKGNECTLIVPYTDCPIIYADYYFLEALMKLENCFNL
ncbi:MAG: glycoside hydrolase family 88 protein [Clostridia bacterium]|nr:glycoside hydrolase family 88 protein [Clostridia bacterium]